MADAFRGRASDTDGRQGLHTLILRTFGSERHKVTNSALINIYHSCPQLRNLQIEELGFFGSFCISVDIGDIMTYCRNLESLVIRVHRECIGEVADIQQPSKLKTLEIPADILGYISSELSSLASLNLSAPGYFDMDNPILENIVHHFTNLRHIAWSSSNHDTYEIKLFPFHIARYCWHLESLDLSYFRFLDDNGMDTIASNCQFLTTIKLSGCKEITDEAVWSIARNLSAISTLCLDGCEKVTDFGVFSLIHYSRKLKHLNVFNCLRVSFEAVKRAALQSYQLHSVWMLTFMDDKEIKVDERKHTFDFSKVTWVDDNGNYLRSDWCSFRF